MNQDALRGCIGCFAVVVVMLLVASLFGLGITTVNPGQAAITTRFGKMGDNSLGEGFYVKPFTKFTKYDLKTNQVKMNAIDAGSKDGQFVYVDVNFTYSLKSEKLTELYSNVGNQDNLLVKFIEPTLRDTIKQVTAQYGANTILPSQAKFREDIQKLISERMNQEYLTIGDLQITNIDFTPEYNAAIEQKQIAQQNAEKAKFELEKTQTQAKQQAALQESLTAEILQKMWIEKWNGILPTSMYITDAQSRFLLGAK